MIDIKDIEKLSELARIKVTDAEKASLAKEIDSILAYVDQLKTAAADAPTPALLNKNVMREDSNPHEPSAFTEILLQASPDRDGQYFKVKKILGGSDN